MGRTGSTWSPRNFAHGRVQPPPTWGASGLPIVIVVGNSAVLMNPDLRLLASFVVVNVGMFPARQPSLRTFPRLHVSYCLTPFPSQEYHLAFLTAKLI